MPNVNWTHALIAFALGWLIGPLVIGTVTGFLGRARGEG